MRFHVVGEGRSRERVSPPGQGHSNLDWDQVAVLRLAEGVAVAFLEAAVRTSLDDESNTYPYPDIVELLRDAST